MLKRMRKYLNRSFVVKSIARLRLLVISSLCFVLGGCGDRLFLHEKRKPEVDLRKVFNGKLVGFGSFFDYRGAQGRGFTLKMRGEWRGNAGKIEETFVFDDGEILDRNWTIEFTSETEFIAKADDVEGLGKGRQVGNAVNTVYSLIVPYNNSKISISANDWVYHIKDGMLISRISLRKFGFKVGEFVISLWPE
ncbi:MAG: DUF3833 family protein [Rickettsiaceae bacterium]|nr:DUF3833 family protein [Rickettsiaceae bacterium]